LNSRIQLNLTLGENPISSGTKQSLILEALDPNTGMKVGDAHIRVTVSDPSGNVVKQFDTPDGDLDRSFKIDKGSSGTFKVTADVLSDNDSVISTKSIIFDVQ
jgi:hypothetical protein